MNNRKKLGKRAFYAAAFCTFALQATETPGITLYHLKNPRSQDLGNGITQTSYFNTKDDKTYTTNEGKAVIVRHEKPEPKDLTDLIKVDTSTNVNDNRRLCNDLPEGIDITSGNPVCDLKGRGYFSSKIGLKNNTLQDLSFKLSFTFAPHLPINEEEFNQIKDQLDTDKQNGLEWKEFDTLNYTSETFVLPAGSNKIFEMSRAFEGFLTLEEIDEKIEQHGYANVVLPPYHNYELAMIDAEFTPNSFLQRIKENPKTSLFIVSLLGISIIGLFYLKKEEKEEINQDSEDRDTTPLDS